MWPTDVTALAAEQRRLARLSPEPWEPPASPDVGGCFVCFGRGGSGTGAAGDPGWAAAAILRDGEVVAESVVSGPAGGPYTAGFLALREGRLLADAVSGLSVLPDVLLVDATGRDHPRRTGLALQLGAVLGLPTIGVTHRPLLADGPSPGPSPGETAPLRIDGEIVGCWLRVREDARPLAVHPGWRVPLDTAVEVVDALTGGVRTPAPLREARRRAREARARSEADPLGTLTPRGIEE
jgi:deoxyribonuclease V